MNKENVTETVAPIVDENEQIAQRKTKLNALREAGNAYPNDFRPTHFCRALHHPYDSWTTEQLQQEPLAVIVAGRIMTRRLMGKASFLHLRDMTGQIQVYLRANDLPEGVYAAFQHWDLGDIIGISGFLFKTKTGELSIHAQNAHLLTKSLRPLPEKFHGLADQEACYRQRYLDLLVNEKTRQTFLIRTQVIDVMRDFLKARHFIEVETPMMQVLPGGASARPFVTQHHALDMELYLRIAPELYLKRLVVGGFDRVFEINRNFRNEGISTRHNPEFTMVEFYQAYADYRDLMDLTEALMRHLAQTVLATQVINYQGDTYDFSQPFTRMSLFDAILHFNPTITADALNHRETACQLAESLGIAVKPSDGLGKIQVSIFEETAEHHLKQPTFITEHPAEVSPLARRNDNNPFVTDRFEFYIGGRELANGFSELNDPEDQAERFRLQVAQKEAGDIEAMYYDHDYITALEHGLPPTAGEGIGIDRLVMLFTDSPSIRDVILFPHMRRR